MRDSQALEAAHRSPRPTRHRAAVIAAGLALAGLAGLTAGCGSDGTDLPTTGATSLPSGLPTALPTGLPTALPTGLPTGLPSSIPGVGRIGAATGADALKGTNVPADFPIPPGAKVKVGTTTGRTSTVTLTGVDGDKAAAFYRTALPQAGYRITQDVGVGGVARAMSFTGHGITGSIGSAGIGQADASALVFTRQQ
ncbi:PT repeat protein [Frankia canadensis]|uniref:PT repeat protein n=1 Tax=Frankia canadensis TaxID=1836972 RepID=A0A2I2KLX3_9ACTN|nr:hypothetical protein [Frankia canadensis]SNQ46663.1 PT repeat protein [Frankia canadensis]SOU53953.1 PT repeat protein [Frankia canadensis]